MVGKSNVPDETKQAEQQEQAKPLMKERTENLKEEIFQKEDQLRDRLIFLAMDLAPFGRGTYKYLEERTGIPATRWRNVMLKLQMPTLAMLISLMSYRSEYAYWLLTGKDSSNGDSPPRDKWEKFLEYRKWMQENKNATREKTLEWALEYDASMKKN